jgi:uncharacterized repeat protein (TIGR02543 family)
MTSTVIVHAYVDGTETSGVAHVTVSQVIYAGLETLSYSKGCYAPCTLTDLPDNFPYAALVTYLSQPFQQQTFSTGVGTTTTLNFYFSASIKGTLTVYGHWDGADVGVEFTIDGVSGGPWGTPIILELDAGTYTIRGHHLQQDKVVTATVIAGQNTDVIIQMDASAYVYVTVHAYVNGETVSAHVDITDSAGNLIFSLDLPSYAGMTVDLLPGTYHFHGTYQNKIVDQDVIITEPQLVTLTFLADNYTLAIGTTTGGTTSPAPGSYLYNSGATANVSAIANTGYVFLGWTLDGADVGTANPIAVTMGSNHGLFANFIKITDGGGGGELPIGWILMGTGLIILSGAGVYYLWKRKKR